MKAGWTTKRLDDVCEIIMGQSPDGESYNTTGEGVPLINGPVEFSDESFGKTVRSKFTTQPTKLCKEGDLILCVRGSTTGRMNIAGFDACIGRGVAAIRAKEFQPWINHFINSKRDEIHGKGTGATFPNVSGATLAEFKVAVPSLPEQQRIVAILDEAFDGIATARANAEQNLRNARALFESHLQTVFSQKQEGWHDRRLADVCKKITVGHVGSMAKQYKEIGVPFLRSQNIRPFQVSLENVVFIDEAFHQSLSKSCLRPGDVAIVRTGYPGTAAVIPPDLPDSNCSDLVIVRPGDEVDPHYLAAFFNSAYGKDLVAGKLVGAAQKHFNVTAAKEVLLHLPTKADQAKIVRQIGDFREETERLESLYQRKLDALDELKKSLLHQAFSGQL
ncbi:MAG: type I restriction enzyme, S subunit [Azoarcus sp.]|nr:type I restriction enzyme, S subunit [Azoarcus sp.]